MIKKIFLFLGMIFSLVLALYGILFMFEVIDYNTYTSTYMYDYGYSNFGADFYSYVNNNVAEAVSKLKTIVWILRNASGMLLAGLGLIGFCGFGAAFSSCKTNKTIVSPEEDKVIDTPLQDNETISTNSETESSNTETESTNSETESVPSES